MTSISLTERNSIAVALGIDPRDPSIALLSLTLNGLSTISARGNSITIPVPKHLVRSDITGIFSDLRHVALSGDAARVIARRSEALRAEPMRELVMPAARSAEARTALPTPENRLRTAPTQENLKAERPGRLGVSRASMVAEALGVSMRDLPNYPDVVSKLGAATKCEQRETKNSRAAAVLYISVESQRDAAALLDGLGFKRIGATGASVWAGTHYERVCLNTETKSRASLALTHDGCDLTVSLAEPMTDSFSGNYYSPIGTIVAPEE